MAEKTKQIDFLTYDTRLVDYNIKNRQLTLEEYEAYLKALPEEAEYDWTPVFEEPATPTEGQSQTEKQENPQ